MWINTFKRTLILMSALMVISFTCQAGSNDMNSVTATPVLKQAWSDYLSALEDVRVKMEATPRFQNTPQHRAKAYHTLMEMQAMAYTFAVAPRMAHPRIYVHTGWQTDIFTLGQNGQDFYYGVAFVDGRQKYRLSGSMGDSSLSLLQILSGLFGGQDVRSVGNYDWDNFEVNADGTFDIILSATEEQGNWVKLDPTLDYQFILIRRALLDWQGDAGDIKLERLSEISADDYHADEFDETAIANRIQRATDLVSYLGQYWNIGLYDHYLSNAGEKNKLSLLPGTVTSEVGNPISNYAMAIFELAEDEALIIEMDKAPDGTYWSFQLGDVWSRSLDFTNYLTSINKQEASVADDGSITIVVSHSDPGIKNWLDTAGRVEGTIVFRNYRATTQPVPATRKVSLSDLDEELPRNIERVTLEQRQQHIDYRREGMRKLYD